MKAYEAEELMYQSIQGYEQVRDSLYNAIKEAALRCESSIRFTNFMEGNSFKCSEKVGTVEEPPIARLLVRNLKENGYSAEIGVIIGNHTTPKNWRLWEADYQFSIDVRW